MKLRNKKTGEIRKAEAREDGIYLWDELTGHWWKYELDLLASSWEYYAEPKEPLIKDEKIRKAVRAWADANNINKCKCSDETHCITFETERGMFISFEYAVPIPPEGNFTIVELCGEKEE